MAARRRGRRAGWDLVFGAPKSLSILAAGGDPGPGGVACGGLGGGGLGTDVRVAHTSAVDGLIGHLEERLTMRRTGPDGARLAAGGLVAASFDHTRNAAAEPHLHTHVIVANLSRAASRWGAVSEQDWFFDRVALGALYHLELRHHLALRGLGFEWRLRPDGLADVSGIPRAAVRAASSQSRAVGLSGRYAARRPAVAAPWRDRLERAGRGTGPVLSVGRSAQPEPFRTGQLDDPAVARVVSTRLAVRRSDFRRADVIVALASCYPGGADCGTVTEWADRFCAASIPVRSPGPSRRWATLGARRMDVDLIRELSGSAHRDGPGRTVTAAVEEVLRTATAVTDRYREATRALTLGAGRVHFLAAGAGRSELLAHTEVLSLCREAWERSGLQVEVSSPSPEGYRRWAVLAGTDPYRPGHCPDVLVVDQADRRTSSELLRLAGSGAERLVFVEGGTLPRLTNPASHGLAEVADELGRIGVGEHPRWAPAVIGRTGPGASIGRAAAAELLDRRCHRPASLLIGLGLEEVEGLNRAVLGRDPDPTGPGRFEPGDRVLVLRSRPGLPPAATFGTVDRVGTDRSGSAVTCAWPDGSRTTLAGRRALSALGFGYAATPRLAARAP
jgi:hypothetical protein